MSSPSLRPLVTAARTSPATIAVRLAERNAAAHEQVGDVGRGDQVVGCGLRHALAVEARAADHAGRRGEAEPQRVDGVEEVLLVLLEVLVVGQRQRVQDAVQRGEVRRRRAAPCARSSSAASGFFFCGMIEQPLVQASDSSTKPNSSLDHSTSSAPRRERCVAQVAAAPR